MARPARPRARRPQSRERGSAAAELVLVTPFLVLLLLLAVAAGRLVQARLDVDSAAQQAARAASLARTPAAASAQATQVAQAALAGQSVTCDPAVITPDTGDFVPGGQVTVQVTCTVHLSGPEPAAHPRHRDDHGHVHRPDRRLPRQRPRVQQS